MMDKSEKRFERDIESFLISPKGGYTQFCGQDAEGNWVHTRQHDVSKCIYMDVLCEFIAKTQPKEWAKYTKYYGASAADKLYHRLETTISNQGLLYVLRNGIEDMGCKLKDDFDSIYIDYLVVDKDYRKKGIGRRLILQLENIAREKKVKRIMLNTYSFQSPGFYERMGFKANLIIDAVFSNYKHYHFIKEIL